MTIDIIIVVKIRNQIGALITIKKKPMKSVFVKEITKIK
jgi:hypothetical protein